MFQKSMLLKFTNVSFEYILLMAYISVLPHKHYQRKRTNNGRNKKTIYLENAEVILWTAAQVMQSRFHSDMTPDTFDTILQLN